MHRTEGENNVDNLFTTGPPATNIEARWLNAVQEEICNTIEDSGATLQTAATDTYNQLTGAIQTLSVSAVIPSGSVMYFFQAAAPTGWTYLAAVTDQLLAVKGGANAYNVAGGTSGAGTWAQPSHTHTAGTYTNPNHQHADGTLSVVAHSHAATGLLGPSHTHGVGSYAGPSHTHGDGSYAAADHDHILDYGTNANRADPTGGTPVVSANSAASYIYTDAGSGAITVRHYLNQTQGSGSVDVSGTSAADGTQAVTGTSAADGTQAVTGSTDLASPDVTGSTSNDGGGGAVAGTSGAGNTVSTWRPDAAVGILATKN